MTLKVKKHLIIDSDLDNPYRVETKRLNEQVKRNINRFPEDFMFQLNNKEFINLKSQFTTSSWGGRRNPLIKVSQYATPTNA